MVDVELSASLKVARLNDREFRCLVTGVWPLAAKAEPRGYLVVAGEAATDRDVAHQARCSASIAKATLARLRTLGMLERHDNGFEYCHDWHELNPDPRFVEQRRARDARRQALFRNKELRVAIRERDKDRCRYCGVEVDWHDRRGVSGGTYDHVDPDGPNTAENLVVACRSCNSKKRDRVDYDQPLSEPDLDPELDPDSNPEPSPSEYVHREVEVKEKGRLTSSLRSDVVECFAYWQERCNHPNAKLTADRRGRIEARLREDYSVHDIRQAIEGAARAPFIDERGKRHDDIELICRKGSKLEDFKGRATAPLRAVPNVGRESASDLLRAINNNLEAS